jgi:hypothetical protein
MVLLVLVSVDSFGYTKCNDTLKARLRNFYHGAASHVLSQQKQQWRVLLRVLGGRSGGKVQASVLRVGRHNEVGATASGAVKLKAQS